MVEAYTGIGRADLVLISDLGKSIIGYFKLNKTAAEALQQIKTEHYTKFFAGKGAVQAVGINIYHKCRRPLKVTCAKEEIMFPAIETTTRESTVSAPFDLFS